MLKFTYTETGLHLEQLAHSATDWVNLRLRLSLQVTHLLRVEHCTASFLLPAAVATVALLRGLTCESADVIDVAIADSETIEVSLRGIWLSSDAGDAEGVFVVELGDRDERTILQLWQESQIHISALQG